MDAPKKENPGCSRGRFEAAQQELFERPPFSPEWPSNATKEGQLLAALLTGASFNHAEFIGEARTWRLAAYAHALKRRGWHVRTLTEDGQPWTGKHCGVARYSLDPADIDAMGGAAHG
ncbi:helix-turn-helix domain-containing protein [Thiomonas bhubaneswarensis]|uniref:Helix-turn-helix domain n=1 Tax=Thiomonas bhubaneswarensis TaxID=339866 RepID=A0A0K6I9U3_9BURK|nr:helix-turn-helix domain-containing protein [Thiomonas bhubaneswarensis]CUA99915.1 Helix-turn-helix domain [Thiomonas bhubaneswarensis]